jgi:hypothetical protein
LFTVPPGKSLAKVYCTRNRPWFQAVVREDGLVELWKSQKKFFQAKGVIWEELE